MTSSLAALCQLVEGRLTGDGKLRITGAATLQTAVAGDLTFMDSADKAPRLARCPATAVLVPVGVTVEGRPTIEVRDVHAAFTRIVRHFLPPRSLERNGVSPYAYVSHTARVARGVQIHAGATIGDDVVVGPGCVIHSGAHLMAGCRLAENVTLYPGAVLYENTVVRARAVIHAGAVIGCHGFGYKLVEGRHVLSAQLGYVDIGEDVEVGANTTIDRGTYGPTRIGTGTKIDNQVMVAHNCQVGQHNMICSQVGIAGSTTTGQYVVMAGQVGVRDHVHIGDGAVLGAMAGVVNDVPAGAHMLGAPAIPEREQKVNFALLAKLPEMRRQLKQLTQMVEAMQKDQSGPSKAAA